MAEEETEDEDAEFEQKLYQIQQKRQKHGSNRQTSMPSHELRAVIASTITETDPDTHSAPGNLDVSIGRRFSDCDLELYETELGLNAASTTECGLFSYRPLFLQRFANRNSMLFWMCWFCIVQGMLVNGLIPSSISTIERRFDLSTSTIGRIMQFYDFGYVLFCIPVSYFGGRHSKPLFLAMGILTMSIGSLIFTLPHIQSETYTIELQNSVAQTGLCTLNNDSSKTLPSVSCSLTENQRANNFDYIFLFCFAHFLHGIGATPLFTIGVSYIDENVRPTISSLFLGIFYACAIFGPALGFLLSGALLQFHTDFLFGKQQMASNEADPQWIGAWWIGFVVASMLGLIAFIPILSLPKVMPDAIEWLRTRVRNYNMKNTTVNPLLAKENSKEIESLSFCRKIWFDIRHIPVAVIRIITNGRYMLITLAMAVDGLLLSGASTFMAKYLERQFDVPPSRANVLIGCIMVPMAGLGTMLSGLVIQRYRLTCAKTLKFTCLMLVLSLILSPMYMIYCDHNPLVGVEIGYPKNDSLSMVPTLLSNCNSHCQCSSNEFLPICAEIGNNQYTFYSPCYAGCLEKYDRTKKEFHNCSCIPSTLNASSVQNGFCKSECVGLVPFLMLFTPFVFFTFAVGVPLISIVLRTVEYEERAFALGIQWIIVRLIGTIPAPVLFGWMFDVSCLDHHMDLCTGIEGSCNLYYNKLLADLFLAFCIVGQTITLLLIIGALLCYSTALEKELMQIDQVHENNNAL